MERASAENKLDKELGELMELIHGQASVHIFQHLSRAMHEVDLSFSQLMSMFRLLIYGPQSIADLAAGANLSHAAASRMVEKLVRDGLAHRSQDPDDRRQKLVRLSQKGEGHLKGLRVLTARAYAGLFTGAPGRLREELWSVLNEIKPHLPLGS